MLHLNGLFILNVTLGAYLITETPRAFQTANQLDNVDVPPETNNIDYVSIVINIQVPKVENEWQLTYVCPLTIEMPNISL